MFNQTNQSVGVQVNVGSGSYRLIEDFDGNWFVIPSDKESEAYDYFHDAYAFEWDVADEKPEKPNWLKEAPDPTKVTFTGYKVER